MLTPLDNGASIRAFLPPAASIRPRPAPSPGPRSKAIAARSARCTNPSSESRPKRFDLLARSLADDNALLFPLLRGPESLLEVAGPSSALISAPASDASTPSYLDGAASANRASRAFRRAASSADIGLNPKDVPPKADSPDCVVACPPDLLNRLVASRRVSPISSGTFVWRIRHESSDLERSVYTSGL